MNSFNFGPEYTAYWSASKGEGIKVAGLCSPFAFQPQCVSCHNPLGNTIAELDGPAHFYCIYTASQYAVFNDSFVINMWWKAKENLGIILLYYIM